MPAVSNAFQEDEGGTSLEEVTGQLEAYSQIAFRLLEKSEANSLRPQNRIFLPVSSVEVEATRVVDMRLILMMLIAGTLAFVAALAVVAIIATRRYFDTSRVR